MTDLSKAIRAASISPVVGALSLSKSQRTADAFHKSGVAERCPPDKSAHISAHNAVRADPTEPTMQVQRTMKVRHEQMLETNYQKAKKRAEKKGRKLPERDEYYSHWGHSYYSECIFSLTPRRGLPSSRVIDRSSVQCTHHICIPPTWPRRRTRAEIRVRQRTIVVDAPGALAAVHTPARAREVEVVMGTEMEMEMEETLAVEDAVVDV